MWIDRIRLSNSEYVLNSLRNETTIPEHKYQTFKRILHHMSLQKVPQA